MIDLKRTLLNLHETFPEFDLDTLIKITECITTETPYIKFSTTYKRCNVFLIME